MSHNPARPPISGLLVLTLSLSVPACVPSASPGSRPATQGRLITAEQIEQSGAENVWQVLRSSGTQLVFTVSGGRPVTVSRRGQVGSDAGGAPLIVLDGVPTAGLDLLNLPAAQVASIRVLTSLEAAQLYGMRGGAGAILIQTRRGPRR